MHQPPRHVDKVDMLNGSLLDKILLFAIPLAASMILQQLFNSADVAVVGRFDSPQAMAAVGSNSQAINLMVNLFVGLSVGANVIIANYIGKGKTQRIHEAIHTAMSLALISGIILLIWGLTTARITLELMDTPKDVLEMAVLYFRLYFLGMPFIMLYNFGAAILRSQGDSKRPLLCLLIGGIVNVILNLILVIIFKLSVAGVAIATVVSNIISAFMIINYLRKSEGEFKFRFRDLKLKGVYVVAMLKIGLPAGLQGMLFSISNVCIQTAINSLGSYASAGSAAALNFDFITFFFVNAFTQAAVTFTGQNFGAKKFDRCKKIYKLTMLSGLITTGLACFICVWWWPEIIGLYTTDETVLKFAGVRMLHAVAFLWMCNIYEIPGGCLRGMGYSTLPAVLVLTGCCVLRIIWVYTVFAHFKSFGILMNVYPVSWAITGVATLMAYYCIRKKIYREKFAK